MYRGVTTTVFVVLDEGEVTVTWGDVNVSVLVVVEKLVARAATHTSDQQLIQRAPNDGCN